MIRLEMKNYNMILIEKLPKYQLYNQTKLVKYKYLAGEEILPSSQKQIIEKAKFTYPPLRKSFEKQIKTIEDQGKKQVKTLEDLKLKEQTKAIEDKSDNKLSLQKENYDRL